MVGKEVYFCRVKDETTRTKVYSFGVKNNVENVTCKIRILYGTEKKIKDTLFTYIACSSSCSSAVETDYMIRTIYTWMDVTTRSSI